MRRMYPQRSDIPFVAVCTDPENLPGKVGLHYEHLHAFKCAKFARLNFLDHSFKNAN